MVRHTHQYAIADDEAVKVLLDKLLSSGPHQQRREKLLKALDDASQHYNSTTQKERKAFPWTPYGLRGRPQTLVKHLGVSELAVPPERFIGSRPPGCHQRTG